MAERFYEINLHDPNFALLSEQQTRTIIGATKERESTGDNRPGIAYMHNVMPSEYGLDSVGYNTVIPPVALPAGVSFSDVRVAYGDAKSKIYIAWDSLGNVYVLINGFTIWLSLPATIPSTKASIFSTESVTIGTVNGVSYIYYSKIGAFNYNEITRQLDAVTLTGLNISATLGVVASSGYLVAYTDIAIAWSSTLDPTDFIPSQVTGSGGGNVAGTAGAILFCVSNTLGLLVYTANNTLAGTYTGNVQFPFKFREIQNSEGGISLDKVAYEANGSKQYVFSKAGLQALDSRGAEVIIPEVTDFLAGKRFETYNEITNQYEVTDLPTAKKCYRPLPCSMVYLS